MIHGRLTIECNDCGETVYANDNVDVEALPGDHVCTVSKAQLRIQFGASDVEHLALAMYRAFHAIEPHCCTMGELDEWKPYHKLADDTVVQAFRRAAMNVADLFSDGEIGSIYYTDTAYNGNN